MDRTRLAICTFAFVLATAVSLLAEQPTFHSQSNVVLVPVLVKDSKRNPIYGLHADDFIVEDEGIPQTLRLDEELTDQPASIILVIQRGRSSELESQRMQSLGAMIEPVIASGRAKVAVVTFGSKVRFKQDFTDNAAVLSSTLADTDPQDGGAAILDALAFSVEKLSRLPKGSQRVILLISETRDHGSKSADIDQVVTAIGSSNIVIYALALSPTASNVLDTLKHGNDMPINAGPDLLAPILLARQAMRKNTPKTIAAMTGGEYELFTSRKAFESHITDFTNHLHSRYLLSFQPKDPKPGLHAIRVRLRDKIKGSAVRGRSNYWAK